MLTAHTDTAQHINGVALVLVRAFIDRPSEGMFAADIGRSARIAGAKDPEIVVRVH